MLKIAYLWTCLIVLLSACLQAQEKPQHQTPPIPSIENHDDGFPMPAGALMRFGNRFLRHPGSANSLAISPDGRYLATQDDDNIVVWDMVVSKAKRIITAKSMEAFNNRCCRACFTNDSKSLIVPIHQFRDRSNPVCSIQMIEIDSGRSIYSTKLNEEIKIVWLTENGSRVGCLGEKSVQYLDSKSGKLLNQVRMGSEVERANFYFIAPKVNRLVCNGERNRIFVLNVESGDKEYEIACNDFVFRRAALSKKGNYFCYFDAEDEKLIVHSFTEKKSIAEIDFRNRIMPYSFFDEDDTKILLFEEHGGVSFISLHEKERTETKLIPKLPEYSGGHAVFSKSVNDIYFVDGQNDVRKIDIHNRKITALSEGYRYHPQTDRGVDGKYVVVSDGCSRIDFWNMSTGSISKTHFLPQGIYPFQFRVTSDWKWLIISNSLENMRIVDLQSGKKIVDNLLPEDASNWHDMTREIVVCDDTKHVLVASRSAFRKYEIQSGRCVSESKFHPNQYLSCIAARSIKGLAWYATYYNAERRITNCQTHLFDLNDGSIRLSSDEEASDPIGAQSKRRFGPSSNIVGDIVPCSSGSRLFTANGAGEVRIRDTDTGSILRKFEPNSALRTFAVSPSEKWLAISQNRRVSLVEVASGKLIHECNGHDTYISQVAFLDDGERLLSSGDNAPILWTLKPQNLPIIPALDDHLWEKLAGDDAAEIYQLQWALLGDSKRTIEWLAKQVKPGIWMNKKEFDALATDLDSIRFAVREKAEAALIVKNHEIPLNWLKQVRTSSEEVNSRIERIRKARPTGPAPRELLRLERALHLLELANSAEAKTLLKAWSNQSPETQLTHEAKLSWERLIERENKSTDKSDWIKRVEKTKKP